MNTIRERRKRFFSRIMWTDVRTIVSTPSTGILENRLTRSKEINSELLGGFTFLIFSTRSKDFATELEALKF